MGYWARGLFFRIPRFQYRLFLGYRLIFGKLNLLGLGLSSLISKSHQSFPLLFHLLKDTCKRSSLWSFLYVMYLRKEARIALATLSFWAEMKVSRRTRMARLMSSSRTCSRRCILAFASAIRIMLSKWRTVMGTDPGALLSLLKSAYKLLILSLSMLDALGNTFCLLFHH